MRIIALSDVHGNLPALEAVLDSIRTQPDMILVGGDSVNFGPQSAEVVNLLRSRGALLVKGNVDDYVANPGAIDRLFRHFEEATRAGQPFRPLLPVEVIARTVEWTRKQLGEGLLNFVKALPFAVAIEPAPGRVLKMVHANPYDLEKPIVLKDNEEELAKMLKGSPCDILVFGHSHNPFKRQVGGSILVDAASLGFPSDGISKAAYAEITHHNEKGWAVEIHRVAYDLEKTASLIEASTMPDKEVILTLLRTARRVKGNQP